MSSPYFPIGRVRKLNCSQVGSFISQDPTVFGSAVVLFIARSTPKKNFKKQATGSVPKFRCVMA